jgi:hypothetical protein
MQPTKTITIFFLITGFFISKGIHFLFPLQFYLFNLYPFNLFTFILPLLFVTRKLCRYFYFIYVFALGVIIDGFIFHIMKDHISYYSSQYTFISILLVSIYIILLVLNKKNISNNIEIDNIFLINFLILVVILMYRFSYYLMIDIPNEERSFMINMYEIHHINIGILLLALVTVFESYVIKYNFIYIMIIAFSIGSIFDQSTYYSLKIITDESYASNTSLLGAFFSVFVFLFLSFFIKKVFSGCLTTHQ